MVWRAWIAILMILLHGTTRARGEQILRHGPNPFFQEPGGQAWEDGFSMNVEAGPFLFGSPEDYARGKARQFPDEGGPFTLAVDVPDDIVRRAVNDWFPLSQGLVQFDPGAGLEELIAAWPFLSKRNPDRHVNSTSLSQEHLQRTFEPGRRGVVGLVDDLLSLCREQGLQLDWQADRCRVRPLGARPQESTEVALPKSVFRAILARMAALCNERVPDSVSPYGGEGELSVGTSPPTIFRVAFTNTPGEQRLEVRRLADHRDGATADGASVDRAFQPDPSART
jgi:hypothetical protein